MEITDIFTWMFSERWFSSWIHSLQRRNESSALPHLWLGTHCNLLC